MSIRRLVAIMFIFVCTFIAWMILGAVNLQRTDESYQTLRQEVQSLFGSELTIAAPRLLKTEAIMKTEIINGVERQFQDGVKETPMDVTVQKVRIDLRLDRRQKGVLWFPTYNASLNATYRFAVPGELQHDVLYLQAPFRSSDSIYNNVRMALDDHPINDISTFLKGESLPVSIEGRRFVTLSVAYDATGMEQLSYRITPDEGDISQIRNLHLEVTTDFRDIDFVSNTLSPTTKTSRNRGWHLLWQLDNSVTGKDIGVIIPNRLNPGEIISRVTFFAPVPLLFFFFIVMMISLIRRFDIHPMHYFFLATSFFSFHLIFSYYSDHMNIYLAFAIASAISLVLTATYLRQFTPPLFALLVAPLCQLIYLIVFSFSFFFKGTTGFIGATFSVLTLFALMQLTGKLDWNQVFDKKNGESAGNGPSVGTPR